MPLLIILLLLLNLPVNAAPPVTIEGVRDRDDTVLVATNSGYAPVYLRITFSQLQHAQLSTTPPHAFVVPPRQTMDLVVIRPASKSIPAQWSYRYTSTWGDPKAVHFPGSRYQLPFEPGTPFTVSQAFDRPSTHSRPSTQNAIDFSVPERTPIVAARAGIVIDRVLSHTAASTNIDHLHKANYVLIAHEDGSIATYAHLSPHISYVHVGQKVSAGQRIALSGNTGYSGGPHLHFSVTVNRSKESASVPVTFVDAISRQPLPTFHTGFRGTVSIPANWRSAPPPAAVTTNPSQHAPAATTISPSPYGVPPSQASSPPTPANPSSPSRTPSTSSSAGAYEPYKLMSLGEIASRTLADLGNIGVRAYHYYTTGKASPGLTSRAADDTRYIELAMPAVLSAALAAILCILARRFVLHARRAHWGACGLLSLLIFGSSYIALNLYSAHTLRNESPLLLISYFTQYATYDPGGTLFLLALVFMGVWSLLRMAAPPERLTYLSPRPSSFHAEPGFSAAPPQPASSPTEPSISNDPDGDLDALQKALKTDPNAAHRLVHYELLSDPSISQEEAVRRAYRRFSS